MTFKNALTAGLLLFVVAALVSVVAKSSPNSDAPEAVSVSQTASTPAADYAAETDGLTATFFHAETRCPSCRNIETYARAALEERFADEIQSGKLQWRTANYEAPENKQLVTEYEVFSSTVVLVRTVNGKPVDWRNLSRVWDFIDDERAFKDYVQRETQELMSL